MANWQGFDHRIRQDVGSTSDGSINVGCKIAMGDLNFMSDGHWTSGATMVAIEIERGQSHPDTNVLKYWSVYENRKPKLKRIVLFHVFLPYEKKRPSRVWLSKFVAEKMKRKGFFEYHHIDLRASKSDNSALSDIVKRLRVSLDQEFKPKAVAGR